MARRKTSDDYHAIAYQHGLQWLGPEVPNIQTLTRWRCPKGHEWEMRYGNIYMGQGCPRCSIDRRVQQRRYKPKDYYTLAQEKGFTWLGPEVKRTQEPTGWRCPKGHEWYTKYNTIQQGRGCPFCAGVVPKTSDDFQALAQEQGFKWLGTKVTNTYTHTKWECAKGHVWSAPYKEIRIGRGCPNCAKKQDDDYHTMAASRDLFWLGPKPSDVTKKTNWRCKLCNCDWKAPYSSLQQGSSCPQCAVGRQRKQPDDYHAVAQISGLEWLGPEVKSNKIKTNWQCNLGHVWKSTYDSIQGGHGCPVCKGINNAQKQRLKPKDYKKLAQEKELIWLGPEVYRNSDKTKWECSSGHIWETTYDIIKGGSNCPECQNFVNGSLVSQLQKDLCKMVGGELNVVFDVYWLDVVVEHGDIRIDIEYDGWYWHRDKLKDDAKRDEFLIEAGWHVLRIRSGAFLPSPDQLEKAILRLINGETWVEIVLDDWKDALLKYESES